MIHSYRLNGKKIWGAPVLSDVSIGWRKLLTIRDTIRPYVIYQVGDGNSVSAWHDNWSDYGPIEISHRDIHSCGLDHNCTVRELINKCDGKCPPEWLSRYPGLNNIQMPILVPRPDALKWRDWDGNLTDFSVCGVWNSIRDRSPKVPWFPVVWFTHCIPRHSFMLWLAMGENLKTQDKLRQWEMTHGDPLVCSLCEVEPDSHNHLFFSCPFSAKVWDVMRSHIEYDITGSCWKDFLVAILPTATRNSAKCIVAKLLFSAAIYFIWQERNCRFFRSGKRNHEKVVKVIMSTVRLKLLSIKWKDTDQAKHMKDKWKIP
ncbi:uncharacterized protein [Rutidosis leptorrhynchoides]|uniref:uncharacterized protein n=1 Tax=Rutidosis leptorrhynchoides TaxID=125765 RepID=UPI003A99A7DE